MELSLPAIVHLLNSVHEKAISVLRRKQLRCWVSSNRWSFRFPSIFACFPLLKTFIILFLTAPDISKRAFYSYALFYCSTIGTQNIPIFSPIQSKSVENVEPATFRSSPHPRDLLSWCELAYFYSVVKFDNHVHSFNEEIINFDRLMFVYYEQWNIIFVAVIFISK